MARKLRLEFPGAIYHVINRGNYRAFVFRSFGARRAFEQCLFEACERSCWLLHAFVVMGNHYHLALETPRGNLAAGMHWLQSTFANRFNRLRGEHGHLFQGRYKALLVEEGERLGALCHYINLNPVRAGLVSVTRLADYRHSGYWYLHHPRKRPAFLRLETALIEAGHLADTPDGRRNYREYLKWQMAAGPAGRSAAYVSMSRGWAIGSKNFKRTLLEDHAVAEEIRAWESEGALQVREGNWQIALENVLRNVSAEERQDTRGLAPWKIKAATIMKTSTDATNRWLADRLKVGSPCYLAKLVSHVQHR